MFRSQLGIWKGTPNFLHQFWQSPNHFYAPCCSRQFIVVEGGFLPSWPLTAHLYVNPTMKNLWQLLVWMLLIWRLLVWQLLDWQLPVWCLLCFAVTVDCFRFCVGWIGGVGSASFRLCQILPQPVSCSGFRGSGFWGTGFGGGKFGSCWIQAASVTPSGCVCPQVLPRPQNVALPNLTWRKLRVHPCHSWQMWQ